MIASSSTCLIGCLPNLVRSMCGCMATKLMGLKIHPGSYGVTRVKNVNHVKNWKQLQFKILLCHLVDNNQSFKKVNGDLVICTLRGQRSKCVIFSQFSKCFSSYRLNSMVTWLLHIDQLDTLYKSYGSKNSSGVIWGRGQKLIFTNAVTPTDYMVWSCDSCICIS